MKRVLVAILVICAGLPAQNIQYRPDPSWRPPDSAAARVNPLAGSPELAAGGRKLFQRHCAQCHGAQGQGLKNAADLQLPVVQQQGDGALFWKITNGNPRRAMPSFSGLPEMQRWQIVLYLRTLPSTERSAAQY
ncbi:MAG TPA: cytochrome c [Terriglobales bacterium]